MVINQLQTLNDVSIYKGNPSVCGSPLSTKCLGDETFDSTTFVDDNVEDKHDRFDIESIRRGSIVGLLVKKSRRHDIKDRISLKHGLEKKFKFVGAMLMQNFVMYEKLCRSM